MRCSRCKQDKPEDAFAKSKTIKRGRQWKCKICCAELHQIAKPKRQAYYKKHFDERRDQRNLANRKHYYANQEKLAAKSRAYYLKKRETLKGRAAIMFNSCQDIARRKNQPFDITVEFILDALTIGKCQKSGLDFDFSRRPINSKKSHRCPSIDRIDSEKYYTQDNVQFVCAMYNFGKNDYSDQDFIDFCKAVAAFNP